MLGPLRSDFIDAHKRYLKVVAENERNRLAHVVKDDFMLTGMSTAPGAVNVVDETGRVLTHEEFMAMVVHDTGRDEQEATDRAGPMFVGLYMLGLLGCVCLVIYLAHKLMEMTH